MDIIVSGLLESKERLMACYKITLSNGYFYYGSSVNVRKRIKTWQYILLGKCKSRYNDLIKESVKSATFAKIEIVKYFDEKTNMRNYETYLIGIEFNSPFSLNLSPSSVNTFGYKRLPNKAHSIPKEVVKLNLLGNLIETYKSVSYAAESNNTRLSAIQKVLDGSRISHNGFLYAYKNELNSYIIPKPKNKSFKKGKRKEVMQLDLNGNILNKYKNIASASKQLGVSTCGISHAISGKQKTASGYLWKWA